MATKSAKKRATKTATKATKARKAAKTVENEQPWEPGSTSLVIVESPAKAKTIGKYLGRAYRVRATIGHVRDLPEKKMGIDIENGFQPEYVTIPGKEKTVAELKSAAREAKQIKSRNAAPVRRVLFHEITRDAVQQAIANAGNIDERKVDAQQARRVLD